MFSGLQIRGEANSEAEGEYSVLTGALTGLSSSSAPGPQPQEMKVNSDATNLAVQRHKELKRLESTYQAIKALKEAADARLVRAIKNKNKEVGEVQRLEALKQSSGLKTFEAMHQLTNGDALNANTTAKILSSMPTVTQPLIGTKLRLARIAVAAAQKVVDQHRAEKMDLLTQLITPIEQTLKLNRIILGDLERFANVNEEMDETIQEVLELQLPLASGSEIRRFLDICEKKRKAEEEVNVVANVSSWLLKTLKLTP